MCNECSRSNKCRNLSIYASLFATFLIVSAFISYPPSLWTIIMAGGATVLWYMSVTLWESYIGDMPGRY